MHVHSKQHKNASWPWESPDIPQPQGVKNPNLRRWNLNESMYVLFQKMIADSPASELAILLVLGINEVIK